MEEYGRLIYLVLLGLMVGSYFFVNNRHKMGQMVQFALIWILIFGGGVVLYAFKDELSRGLFNQTMIVGEGGEVVIPRSLDGHFYVTLNVNGEDIDFVVDTGATSIALRQEDAVKIGYDPSSLVFSGRASTANGDVRTASVILDTVALGGFMDEDIPAWVNEGEMSESLLGMTYLSRFDRLEIAGDMLTLTR